MGVKRDSVNRKERLICMPIILPNYVKAGDTIELANIKENEINPDIKDPMAGFGQPDGSNYGDAVFDPMDPAAKNNVFDPMK